MALRSCRRLTGNKAARALVDGAEQLERRTMSDATRHRRGVIIDITPGPWKMGAPTSSR
jgi:hypothetical protein